MNKVIIMGRLTRDPEVRYTPTQKVVCQFTVAVDRPFLNQEGQREADFIPVVVWGKAAELCGNSLAKGHRILVEGRLQIRSYDGKDGNRHWVTEIIANNVEFVERKADSANRNGAGPAQGQEQTPAPKHQQQTLDELGTYVPYDQDVAF